MNALKLAASTMVIAGIVALFFATTNFKDGYAQNTTNSTGLNMTMQPETITNFEEIEGNDSAIISNNTEISNPNNTISDAIEINGENN